jgi:hypothetical protein|tara:strand:+ start:753 stop:938 length:186 start_codon:yes stop_codon:yes gene_type:complete
MNINWINSWRAVNKKNKYELNWRIGKVTLLQIEYCPCIICNNKKTSCSKFRFMIVNFGFEI